MKAVTRPETSGIARVVLQQAPSERLSDALEHGGPLIRWSFEWLFRGEINVLTNFIWRLRHAALLSTYCNPDHTPPPMLAQNVAQIGLIRVLFRAPFAADKCRATSGIVMSSGNRRISGSR